MKTLFQKKWILSSLLLAAGASAAQADTTSTATNPAAAPRLTDRLILSYYADYAGPSVTNPTRAAHDSASGELDEVQSIDSTVTAGYKLTDNLRMTGSYRFIVLPMNTDGDANYFNHNPWIAVKAKRVIDTALIKTDVDGRLYLPLRTNENMNFGLRSTQVTTMDVPGTRLTLGVDTLERANALGRGGKSPNLAFAITPNLSYQLASTVALFSSSDVLDLNIKFNEDINLPEIPVRVGASWDITSKVNLSPRLTFFPSALRLNNVTMGAEFSASLF